MALLKWSTLVTAGCRYWRHLLVMQRLMGCAQTNTARCMLGYDQQSLICSSGLHTTGRRQRVKHQRPRLKHGRLSERTGNPGESQDISTPTSNKEEFVQQQHARDQPLSGVEKLLNDSRSVILEEESHEFPSDVTESSGGKYKNYNEWVRDQTRKSKRPQVDPRETSILLFPGQGSQFVGMGQALLEYPGVKDLYDVASGILGYDLLQLCLAGPKQQLDQTVYCQPAVMVTSLAAVEKLKHDTPWAIETCVAAAGFSVGEYSALVFGGSMSFEDAVHIIKVRAEAMQEASEATPSGMLSVFTGHDSKLNFACHTARRYCTERLNMADPTCEVANYLYPDCKVVAGNIEALEFLEKNGRDFGLRRTKRLPVSGAFHTRLMKPARQPLVEALGDVRLRKPAVVSVHCNVDACRHLQPRHMTRQLADQLCKPVRWEQTIHAMYDRPNAADSFPHTWEVGPGRQLGTILKLLNNKAFQQYNNVPV